jgi:hypothetical protein
MPALLSGSDDGQRDGVLVGRVENDGITQDDGTVTREEASQSHLTRDGEVGH